MLTIFQNPSRWNVTNGKRLTSGKPSSNSWEKSTVSPQQDNVSNKCNFKHIYVMLEWNGGMQIGRIATWGDQRKLCTVCVLALVGWKNGHIMTFIAAKLRHLARCETMSGIISRVYPRQPRRSPVHNNVNDYVWASNLRRFVWILFAWCKKSSSFSPILFVV